MEEVKNIEKLQQHGGDKVEERRVCRGVVVMSYDFVHDDAALCLLSDGG